MSVGRDDQAPARPPLNWYNRPQRSPPEVAYCSSILPPSEFEAGLQPKPTPSRHRMPARHTADPGLVLQLGY